MTRTLVPALLAGILALSPPSALAAIYYVGAFTGSTPLNDTDCGTGLGNHPSGHPCATLEYFNANRLSSVDTRVTNTIRLTGTLTTDAGSATRDRHCLIAKPRVTYEGRTADNTQPATADAVTVDLTNTPAATGVCQGQSIVCGDGGNGCDFTDMTVRYVRLFNAPGATYNCMRLRPGTGTNACSGTGGTCNNLTFDHVHFDRCLVAGTHIHHIGNNICGGVESGGCPRDTKNVLLSHVEVNDTKGHSVIIGAVDGLTIEHSKFHHNGRHWCNIPGDPLCDGVGTCDPDCKADDGLAVGGAINFTIRDSQFYRNRQCGLDLCRTGAVQDNCPATVHTGTVERVQSYDNGYCSFDFCACVHNITVKNSFAWGTGGAWNMYYGACNIRAYNNTFVPAAGTSAVQLYSHHTQMDFRNNIIRCNTTSPGGCVKIGAHTLLAGAGSTWDGNVVTNTGTANDSVYVLQFADSCASDTADPDYPCAKVPCASACSGIPCRTYADTAVGLTNFRNAAYPGLVPGYATNDSWGTAPIFSQDPLVTPNASNLHLHSSDTIAKDKGLTLPVVTNDFDLDARPGGSACDVGADEIGSGALSAPVLLSVDPIP